MLCDIFEATNKFETGSFFDVFFSRAFDHGFGFCKRKRDLYSIRILKVADSSKLNFRGETRFQKNRVNQIGKPTKPQISSDYFLTQASKKRSMMMMVEESTVGVCEKWNEGQKSSERELKRGKFCQGKILTILEIGLLFGYYSVTLPAPTTKQQCENFCCYTTTLYPIQKSRLGQIECCLVRGR